MIRQLVRRLPLSWRKAIHAKLISWASVAARLQSSAANRLAVEETKDMQFSLVVSRTSTNAEFNQFGSLDDAGRKALLGSEFGWDMDAQGIISSKIIAVDMVRGTTFGYEVVGFIEFASREEMVLWKLSHIVRD